MDLIIDDDYIKEMGIYLNKLLENLSEVAIEYNSILKEILENGIQKGNTHAALQEFENQASSLGEDLAQIGTMVNRYCKGFITSIDEADRELYYS